MSSHIKNSPVDVDPGLIKEVCVDEKVVANSKVVTTTDLNHLPPIALPRWSKEWVWEIRGSMLVIMTTITLAIFTDIFLYAVIVPVVPYAFEERLGIAENAVQGAISKALAIYSVGLIVGSLIFGYVADKIKRRQMLMIGGLTIIIGSNFILMFARVIWLYLVGRLIQGLSASIVWVVGLAIIADSGDPENMAFLMSFPGIGMSLGIFLGPFIGGIAYEQSGYYSVFYICFGILAVDIILRFFMLERSELFALRHKRALELSQSEDAATLSPELSEYVARYSNFRDDTEEYKQRACELQDEFGPKINLFGRRYNLPVFFALLCNRRVACAVFLGVSMAWIMASIDTTMTLHLAELFGFNSLQSGLVFLALAGPTLLEPLAGKVSDRYGSKYCITFGYVMLAPFFILLRIPDEKTTGNIVLFIVLVVLCGTSLMIVTAPSLAEITKSITELESKHPGIYGKSKGFGQGYGLFNVGFSIGSLIGPFQAGGTKDNSGWGMMTLSIGILSFLVGVIAFLFAGEGFRLLKKPEQKGEVVQEDNSVAHV
ncbi:hypothetical protein DV451_005092 [Geotrichum candidum]|uniref:Major facilitator superfamily (MFS) profile domain-containing protein n=1 Tax=Geotrichum candidum TaxID=1173061 RepID=A0A9P5G1Z6_GEOCN|nr:hypothetical protein DV451_005092 [Geotrichum candidum]